MLDRTPVIRMRDRLLFDEWEPYLEPEYPGAEDEFRFHMFRVFDKAYDLMIERGMDREEAMTTVRVVLGSDGFRA